MEESTDSAVVDKQDVHSDTNNVSQENHFEADNNHQVKIVICNNVVIYEKFLKCHCIVLFIIAYPIRLMETI